MQVNVKPNFKPNFKPNHASVGPSLSAPVGYNFLRQPDGTIIRKPDGTPIYTLIP